MPSESTDRTQKRHFGVRMPSESVDRTPERHFGVQKPSESTNRTPCSPYGVQPLRNTKEFGYRKTDRNRKIIRKPEKEALPSLVGPYCQIRIVVPLVAGDLFAEP